MLAAAALPAVGYVYVVRPFFFPAPSVPPVNAGLEGSTPFYWPAIRRPPVRDAASAGLADDAAVIGVSAGGKHRAYLVRAFAGTMHHVVNDLLGDRPVSVTYCDRTRCTRVFAGARRGDPLDIFLGGFYRDDMMIRTGSGGMYHHSSGEPINAVSPPFPYPTYAHEVTTWKKWRTAHPDTDVYTGEPAARVKT
jgi:hypothetical protein